MGIRERLSGNEAVAYAMKQINPDVMGAYPITPSTEIPQYFSTYVDMALCSLSTAMNSVSTSPLSTYVEKDFPAMRRSPMP